VLRPGSTRARGAVQQMRRLFGMVFQDFQLFPHLTALANVIEAPVARPPPVAGRGHERGQASSARRPGRHAKCLSRTAVRRSEAGVAIARAWRWSARSALRRDYHALDPELKYEVLGSWRI